MVTLSISTNSIPLFSTITLSISTNSITIFSTMTHSITLILTLKH